MIGGGAAFLAAPRHALAGGIETADVLGTPVSLPRRPQRIVLLDATDILSMAALLPDPAERVVGWASAGRLDLGAMTERLAPSLPEVGKLSPDTVSVESVLALEPDLVVASAYMLPPQGSPLSEILRASGIPIAWTSGHNGALSPELSLRRAMAFWGAVLGEESRAAQITDLGLGRFEAVRACASGSDRPRVYMEVMSTVDDCCWGAGRAFWGDLIEMAGGELLAASEGWSGKFSNEGLIALEPEVYVATGGGFAPDLQPGIAPGLDPAAGRAGLRRVASRIALSGAPALRDGRVHGIWSGLVTSPLLVPLLAECLGRWLQPGGCAPLDPAKTLADLNRFFAHPLQGPLWLSLGED